MVPLDSILSSLNLFFWFPETLRTSIDNFDSFPLTFWVSVRPLVPVVVTLFVVRWFGRFRGGGRFVSVETLHVMYVVCFRACSQRDCIILDKICQILSVLVHVIHVQSPIYTENPLATQLHLFLETKRHRSKHPK